MTQNLKKKMYLCKMLNIPPQFESEEWSEGKCSHNKSLILWDNARIWKNFYTFWWCLFYHLIFFPSSFCCAVYYINGKYEQNWTRVSGILLFNLNFWKIEEYNNAESIWGRLYEKVKRERKTSIIISKIHLHFDWIEMNWKWQTEWKKLYYETNEMTYTEHRYIVGLFRYIFWQNVNISR